MFKRQSYEQISVGEERYRIPVEFYNYIRNLRCEGCDLYIGGYCVKYRKNGKAEPSTREWLYEDLDISEFEFISEDKMCRKSSIFGNDYIGITLDDIERIKNGEILHIPGEYGTFIGLVDDEKGEEND